MLLSISKIEFQLYYETFIYICKRQWQGDTPPTKVGDFISMILCRRNLEDLFFSERCVSGRRCLECFNLTLFNRNFLIDHTHARLSYIIVTWMQYKYVTMNPSSSSSSASKRIDLLDDNIPILEFMGRFQNPIYGWNHEAR